MARLPRPGGDRGKWGSILNDYLSQVHASDGTLKTDSVTSDAIAPNAVTSAAIAPAAITTAAIAPNAVTASVIAPNAITNTALASNSVDAAIIADGSITNQLIADGTIQEVKLAAALQTKIDNPTIADATALVKGKIQLAGDLGGTASSPTVPGLATKLDTATAASTYAPLASPTFTGTVTVPTPTNVTDAATKAYVDSAAASGTPDATALVKGKIQLAGDLGGTAASPSVVRLSGVSISGTPSAGDVLAATGSTAASWTALPSAPVTSVAGKTGVVTLGKADVGLSNVDNTSDANKPISTATQTALNSKEPTITAGTTSQYYRGDKSWQTLNVNSISDATAIGRSLITAADAAAVKTALSLAKSDVGLDNVDNTSDATKNSAAVTLTNKTLDSTNAVTLKDTNFTLQDDSDTTKQAQFQLSGITTGTTRTLTVPDASTTLVGVDTTQTLTNKTLTSVTLGGGQTTLDVGAGTTHTFTAAGTGTDVNIKLQPKGAGVVSTDSDFQFLPSAAGDEWRTAYIKDPVGNPTLGIAAEDYGATNYWYMASNIAAQMPYLLTRSEIWSDVVKMRFGTQNSGMIAYISNARVGPNWSDITNFTVFIIQPVASSVNYLQVSSSSTGNPLPIQAAGTDTNISINLVPKGTGTVRQNGVDVVTVSGTQTLTNKTLTTPVISSISNSGTVTIPTGTDTLVNLAGTQTLTNKTLGNTNTVTVKAANLTIQDGTDTTKQARFVASSITTATTRSYTLPDVSDTLVTLTATQTLSNKTLTAPNIGAATGTSLAATGAITSSGGGIGYATGAGGTVVQSTSKVTAFTLSKLSGTITFASDALGADTTSAGATWTNTFIAATDIILFQHISGGTIGAYDVTANAAAGSATVYIRNKTPGSLSEAPVFRFVVIKAVTA